VPRLAAHALAGPERPSERGRSVDASAPLALVGLSMGGFGALLLGGRRTERVHAVAGLSSITRFSQMRHFVGDISGYDVDEPDRSALDALVAAGEAGPRIRFDCGVDDGLLEANRALHAGLDDAGIEHVYEEHPGGHDWAYWRAHLGDALRFVLSSTA
jgi:putative tributyrin esterase